MRLGKTIVAKALDLLEQRFTESACDAFFGKTVEQTLAMTHELARETRSLERAKRKLIRLAKDKLGGVKAPKSVDFIAALPRSPVGKVLKKTLREPYWAGRERKI